MPPLCLTEWVYWGHSDVYPQGLDDVSVLPQAFSSFCLTCLLGLLVFLGVGITV